MTSGSVGSDGRVASRRTSWNAWGDDPAAHASSGLPAGARVFLRREIGLPENAPLRLPVPPDQMRLNPSALADDVRDRLAKIAEVRWDAVSRVAHAGGKSYRDLVRRRAGDAADAPDAVVVPGDAEAVAGVLRVCADA